MGWHTVKAEALADFTWMSPALGEAIGRCRQSGLDPVCYRGLAGAAVILLGGAGIGNAALTALYSVTPFRRWHDDNELLQRVADIEMWLRQRVSAIQSHSTVVLDDLDVARAAPVQPSKVADCLAALEILGEADKRLRYALARVRAVPEDLGETYVAAYATLGRGHALPHEGRWFSGDPLATPPS